MTAGVLEVIEATELTVAAVAVEARQKEAIRRSVGFNTRRLLYVLKFVEK
jgi:hypothetical protein